MDTDDIAGAVVVAGLIVLAVGVGWALSSWECSSRWSMSGMATSWGPVQGCLVKTTSGRWVPDDRIRDIDIEPTK